MTSEDVKDARRHLGAIRTLAACDRLDPESLKVLTARLEGFIDEMEMWLELSSPPPRRRARDGLGRAPIRYVKHLGVIDGDGGDAV